MGARGRWTGAVLLALCATGFAQTAPSSDQDASADDQPQYWFGVAVENIPPSIAHQFKLKSGEGLMVAGVIAGSPADKAGLKPEDLLVAIDGVPVTSQQDLARAANNAGATGNQLGKPREFKIRHVGDPMTLTVTPELRPASMQVMGANMGSFVAGDQGQNSSTGSAGLVHNYALPNGSAAQVGPGYRIDLKGPGASSTAKLIKQFVANNQTIVLTQDRDSSGFITNTIAVDGTVYPIEAGKMNALPDTLRPLGDRILADANTKNAALKGAAGATSKDAEMEARLKALEEQNSKLQQELADLRNKK